MNTTEAHYYHLGKKDAFKSVKGYMLGKMTHYRTLLWRCLPVIEQFKCNELASDIHDELRISPEWQILNSMDHFCPVSEDPNAYKKINIDPDPE